MKTQPITDFLGVELIDFDLSKTISKGKALEIKNLLDEKQLLLLRNQSIDNDQYVDLSRIFSKPIPSILPVHKVDSHPVISIHSNIKNKDGTQAGIMAPKYFWRSDSYFLFNP